MFLCLCLENAIKDHITINVLLRLGKFTWMFWITILREPFENLSICRCWWRLLDLELFLIELLHQHRSTVHLRVGSPIQTAVKKHLKLKLTAVYLRSGDFEVPLDSIKIVFMLSSRMQINGGMLCVTLKCFLRWCNVDRGFRVRSAN